MKADKARKLITVLQSIATELTDEEGSSIATVLYQAIERLELEKKKEINI